MRRRIYDRSCLSCIKYLCYNAALEIVFKKCAVVLYTCQQEVAALIKRVYFSHQNSTILKVKVVSLYII